MNCGTAEEIGDEIDILSLKKIDGFKKSELKRVVIRIGTFLEKI